MKYVPFVVGFIIFFIIFLLKDEAKFRNDMQRLVKKFEKSCFDHVDETERAFYDWQKSTVNEFLDDLKKLTIQCHDVKQLQEKYKKRLAEIIEVSNNEKSANQNL